MVEMLVLLRVVLMDFALGLSLEYLLVDKKVANLEGRSALRKVDMWVVVMVKKLDGQKVVLSVLLWAV